MIDPSRNELLFAQLVAMFQYAAMQQMGKIPNPVTGKIERDLEHARVSIDMVEMLEARTQGSRSARESDLLEKVLFELRMNYVDESKRAEAERPAEPEKSGEPPPPGEPQAG